MTHAAQRTLMALLATFLVASEPGLALAQDGHPSLALTYETPDPTARAMETAERKVRRGRIGLAVSALVTLGGIGPLAVGVSLRAWCESCESTTSEKALVAVGATALIAGTVGILVSGVALGDGRRTKREIEQQRVEADLVLGPMGGSLRVRF